MLLTIHNLPTAIRYSDVKNLLQEKCGLSDLILDNLLPEGNTKRVTVGVSNEGDAAILVRKINGLYMEGQQLYVEDVRKKRELEQPFRSSSMAEKVPLQRFQQQPEQRYPNQQGYPAMDQSMTMQAQYMVQQPMPVSNYSMMGYSMTQVQDSNYVGYQNQAFIPGMQALPEIPAMQEQFKTNKSNESWSGRQFHSAGWEDEPAQTNNSQDRWQNDRPRSRSPHRGGFQEQPRSYDQAKPQWNDRTDTNDRNRRRSPPWQQLQDQYNSVRNDDNPFGRKRSPPRNRDLFEPHGDLEFDRNAQIGSMFSMTATSVNNMQKRSLLEQPVPRPPMFEKPVSRPERLSRPEPYGGNPRGPGPRTQPPNSRFHDQRAPSGGNPNGPGPRNQPLNSRFHEQRAPSGGNPSGPGPRNQPPNSRFHEQRAPSGGNPNGPGPRNQPPNPRFHDQRAPSGGNPNGPGPRNQLPNSRFHEQRAPSGGKPSGLGLGPRNQPPNSRFHDQRAPSGGNARGPGPRTQPLNSRFHDQRAPSGGNPNGPGPRSQPPNSQFHEQRAPRFEEPRNRKNQFTNGQQRRPREEHQGNFGSARFSDGRRDRNSEPPAKMSRPSDPPHFDKPTRRNPAEQPPPSLDKMMKRHETWKGQAAAVISKDIMQNVQSQKKHVPDSNELKALKQAIRARLDVILGNKIGVDNDAMVVLYRSKYGPSTDMKLFNLVLVRVKKEQEAAKATAAAASEVPAADDKPVTPALATQDLTGEPVAAPVTTTPNKKVVQVPAGKIPRFPQGDKKNFQQQKQLQKKEFTGEVEYTLEPPLLAALDSELSAINDILEAECADPQDESEKVVCKHVNSKAAVELNRVLGLTLTKRLLNINTSLLVRVFSCPKMPKRESLEAFLKKYGVVSSKKSVKNKMYVVTVNTFKNFDRLITLGQTTIDGMTVSFKPLQITGPPPKITRDKTKNQKNKSFNKQDEDQDIMEDDNQDTVEEYNEDVEEEHFEMEDTNGQPSDEVKYAHIEDLDLLNVNADDLEDY